MVSETNGSAVRSCLSQLGDKVITNENPGGFILAPFKTDEVQDWLRKDQKQK